MTKKYIEGPNITLQNFYVWLGFHFFMAGFEGIENNKIWWSEKPINMFEGAPFRLSDYMSGRRFQNIGVAIRYTNIELPAFLYRFHDVWKMIDAFNEHYNCEYFPSWFNCLYKLMNSFLKKFCPGFMCVPRKPRPFGNEYYSIANGVTEKGLEGKPIMWRVKLQEGKDRPKKPDGSWAFPSKFPGYSKKVTIMLESHSGTW